MGKKMVFPARHGGQSVRVAEAPCEYIQVPPEANKENLSPELAAALKAAPRVRLLVRDAPYNPGEVIKVSAGRAARWVREGIAEYAR